jgi:hypothetical protein
MSASWGSSSVASGSASPGSAGAWCSGGSRVPLAAATLPRRLLHARARRDARLTQWRRGDDDGTARGDQRSAGAGARHTCSGGAGRSADPGRPDRRVGPRSSRRARRANLGRRRPVAAARPVGRARPPGDVGTRARPDRPCRHRRPPMPYAAASPAHLQSHPGAGIVLGYGFPVGRMAVPAHRRRTRRRHRRPGPWPLASGDGHNGWLNSAAIALIGAPSRGGRAGRRRVVCRVPASRGRRHGRGGWRGGTGRGPGRRGHPRRRRHRGLRVRIGVSDVARPPRPRRAPRCACARPPMPTVWTRSPPWACATVISLCHSAIGSQWAR